ncbi:MAG: KpsF/GutQ family sugar-phosphate isomerase [Candidatus Eisenbacteria bacterium]|nr:KpsF/GutQ family sugar-phosphate isomerase [Candidatus Eisenbacteria bacterium]
MLRIGRGVLEAEADAVRALSARLGLPFARAVRVIVASRGTVVVSGMGKSGVVARKIAATFASTGTPAVFLHPGDAAHGDLGMVGSGDVVLVVSKSGEGDELLRILPAVRALGATIVAITGAPDSALARQAHVALDARVEREACPMDLVPTASTTAALALGDALAVAVLEEKRIDRSTFALYHPGGVLGKRLLLRVRDVMHSGDELPAVREDALMKDALCEIVNKRLGLTTVVDGEGVLVGIITDGDLKRILMQRADILDTRVGDVMTRSPKTIRGEELVATALERMETLAATPITSLVVLSDSGAPDGVIHIHDCLKAVR